MNHFHGSGSVILAILDLWLFPLGRAFSSLGRKEDAVLVWEQGYEHALHQSADLKQLLELKELLSNAEQDRSVGHENRATESASSMLVSESRLHVNGKSSETHTNQSRLSDESQLNRESGISSEVHSKSNDNICNGVGDKSTGKKKLDSQMNGNHDSQLCSESTITSEVHSKSNDNMCNGIGDKARGKTKFGSQMNGNHDIQEKLSNDSESCTDLSDRCNNLPMICSKSSHLAETPPTPPKLSNKSDIRDESKRNKKFCFTRVSKTKSISVDFRLSRGIAEVCCNAFIWYWLSVYMQLLPIFNCQYFQPCILFDI